MCGRSSGTNLSNRSRPHPSIPPRKRPSSTDLPPSPFYLPLRLPPSGPRAVSRHAWQRRRHGGPSSADGGGSSPGISDQSPATWKPTGRPTLQRSEITWPVTPSGRPERNPKRSNPLSGAVHVFGGPRCALARRVVRTPDSSCSSTREPSGALVGYYQSTRPAKAPLGTPTRHRYSLTSGRPQGSRGPALCARERAAYDPFSAIDGSRVRTVLPRFSHIRTGLVVQYTLRRVCAMIVAQFSGSRGHVCMLSIHC
ncbi:hypothetical protein GY45DRAFT_143197 [Cubamyces sp. BRFM 1775]|nr:hypothetical protein GY45DRAFT_143197 [Cubamyces sp. BRFM 1775]